MPTSGRAGEPVEQGVEGVRPAGGDAQPRGARVELPVLVELADRAHRSAEVDGAEVLDRVDGVAERQGVEEWDGRPRPTAEASDDIGVEREILARNGDGFARHERVSVPARRQGTGLPGDLVAARRALAFEADGVVGHVATQTASHQNRRWMRQPADRPPMDWSSRSSWRQTGHQRRTSVDQSSRCKVSPAISTAWVDRTVTVVALNASGSTRSIRAPARRTRR